MSARWIELLLRSPDPDRILVHGLRPLLIDVRERGAVSRGYFLRSPQGLRLRFELANGSTAALSDELARYLTRAKVDEFEVEIDETPAFDELRGLWEGPAAGAFRDDFFSATSAFALDRVAEVDRGTPARQWLCLDLMVAQVVALEQLGSPERAFSAPRAFLTYRS